MTVFELKPKPCEIRFSGVLSSPPSPSPPLYLFIFPLITSEGKVILCPDSPLSLRPSVCVSVRLFMVNFNIGLFFIKRKKL